jgi:hypothetical protein
MTPSSDKRLRPYRALAWGGYLTVAVGFSSLVIYSVTKSVFEMSFSQPTAPEMLSSEACAQQLKTRFDELENQRHQLTQEQVSLADQRWLVFRNAWMLRMRELEAACLRDHQDRAALGSAFISLHRVMDVATVEATQVAGQMGPALDIFRDRLEAVLPR